MNVGLIRLIQGGLAPFTAYFWQVLKTIYNIYFIVYTRFSQTMSCKYIIFVFGCASTERVLLFDSIGPAYIQCGLQCGASLPGASNAVLLIYSQLCPFQFVSLMALFCMILFIRFICLCLSLWLRRQLSHCLKSLLDFDYRAVQTLACTVYS